MEENRIIHGDIAESPRDKKELEQDSFTIDLPDVKDIPGQENVHPPHLGEYADTTISSAGEEGDDLFDDEEEEEDGSNVTEEEKTLLQRTEDSMSTDEDQDVYNAELDDTDNEGEPLNEKINVTGDDLDVPGTEKSEEADDDEDVDAGDEDEENSTYSLGGDNHE